MTDEEAKKALEEDLPKVSQFSPKLASAYKVAMSALSDNKGEWSRHTRVEPVYSIDGVKTWGDKCQCNKCTFTTIVVEGFGYYKFCPNCGADMRGDK